MGVQHAAKILDAPTGFLSAGERAAFLQMAYRADRHGSIRATQREIATDVGLSRRSVAKLYAFIESTALIKKVQHGRYQFESELLDVVGTVLSPSSNE